MFRPLHLRRGGVCYLESFQITIIFLDCVGIEILCVDLTQQITQTMETLFESKDFTVIFNGTSTYFLIDPTGNCVFAADTFRKCKNHFTRIFA